MNQGKCNGTALIVMAHGSRQNDANQEFAALVASINGQDLYYTSTSHCFLELAEPNLLSAAEAAIKTGVKAIEVYPLFFNQGNHVRRDIPKQIAAVKQQYPDIGIKALDYFGCHHLVGNMIAEHITHQKS